MGTPTALATRGRPLPGPSAFRQLVVKSYVRHFAVRTVVETGTYLGAMVMALRQQRLHVYSIELSRALAERAIDLFAGDARVLFSTATAPRCFPIYCLIWNRPASSGSMRTIPAA